MRHVRAVVQCTHRAGVYVPGCQDCTCDVVHLTPLSEASGLSLDLDMDPRSLTSSFKAGSGFLKV